jgi:hypothetical protein
VSLSRLERSHLVIHSCAVGAAFWSGAWGSVPVLGLTPDTAGLVAICTTMGGLLAHVHGKSAGELGFMGAATAAGQYFAGALIVKGLSSFIPIFGTIVNAGISLATVETVGWAFYLIVEEGADPSKLSKSEMEGYLRRGENLQSEYSQSGEFDWMKSLPSDVKKKYDKLSKELAAKDTTDKRRAALLVEIERLLAPYRPPDDKGTSL